MVEFRKFCLLVLILSVFVTGCMKETDREAAELSEGEEIGTDAEEMSADPASNSENLIIGDDFWQSDVWLASTPESQGMDSDQLIGMMESIKKNEYNFNSLLIIRNGHLVMEHYKYPYDKNEKHLINSITKSITSVLIGLAIEDGYIENVDQKVMDFFPDIDIENVDERKEMMTIEHLLTMTSGLQWNEEGDYGRQGNSFTQMTNSDNQLKFALNQPMKDKPGVVFHYNSGNSHILSAIINEATGRSAWEYGMEKLFAPLGISDEFWRSDAQGISIGGTSLFMKPEDLAKIGYLFLNNGKWKGEQIISESWIEQSTKQHISPRKTEYSNGYGYHWWRNTFDGFHGNGFEGQELIVIPEFDLVIVFSGATNSYHAGVAEGLVNSYILPSIKSDENMEENLTSFQTLLKELENFQQPPDSSGLQELPEIAKIISNQTYKLDNDDTYIFEFEDGRNEAFLRWNNFYTGKEFVIPIGLDGVYRIAPLDSFFDKGQTTEAGFRGHWADEYTFNLEFFPIGLSYYFLYEFMFDGTGSKLDHNRIAVNRSHTFFSSTGVAVN